MADKVWIIKCVQQLVLFVTKYDPDRMTRASDFSKASAAIVYKHPQMFHCEQSVFRFTYTQDRTSSKEYQYLHKCNSFLTPALLTITRGLTTAPAPAPH